VFTILSCRSNFRLTGYATLQNLKMPKTFMAVGVDLADPTGPWGDIHPRWKKAQAQRLALGAHAVAYGESGVYWTGPIAVSAEMVGGNPPGVQINFNLTGAAGLLLKHSVGVEVYQPCDANGDRCWVLTPIVRSDAGSITAARSWTSNISHVRYNWYGS
jgi:hypothetical protein